MVSLEGRGRVRKAAPSPGRPEEMTNAQTDEENAGPIIARRGGCRVAAAGKKWRAGGGKEINHDRSQYLDENKQNDDNLPGKKATFLYNEATFYAKAHVFCKNRRLFCHFSNAQERIPRFKMYKLERCVSIRRMRVLLNTH
jgi:hypothetical protein